LVNFQNPLTVSNPIGLPGVIDFIGYGEGTRVFEGSGAAPQSSTTESVRRKDNNGSSTYGTNGNGWDSNDNSLDFYLENNLVGNPPLPVELYSFSAIILENGVKLLWRTETEVSLPVFNGFNFSINLIAVVLDVQKIVDKQFEDITVEVIDIPSRKEVVLLPNKIGFNVRGGIEILGKLKQDQFRAYIRYQSLVQDTTGSVTPVLEMPKNVILQYLKPDKLRYVIRSF